MIKPTVGRRLAIFALLVVIFSAHAAVAQMVAMSSQMIILSHLTMRIIAD
jgi:hypothetical protein